MRAGIETHPFTLWPAQQIDGQVGVDEVATAVPAFVGYTEKAEDGGKPLVNAGGTPKPWRISSMAEFHQYFGYAPRVLFELKEAKTDNSDASFRVGAERKGYLLERAAGRFNLYRGNA